jgi:type IV pilus assembly protein PilP
MNARRMVRSTVSIGAACLAVGCLPNVPHTTKPAPSPETVEPITLSAAPDESSATASSPVERRDPFESPAPRPPARQVRNSTMNYELDQLRLVFTNTGTSSPLAIVIDPAGKGHTIHRGDTLGKAGAIVSGIKRDELTLLTTTEDIRGASYVEERTLRMESTTPTGWQNPDEYEFRVSDPSRGRD